MLELSWPSGRNLEFVDEKPLDIKQGLASSEGTVMVWVRASYGRVGSWSVMAVRAMASALELFRRPSLGFIGRTLLLDRGDLIELLT
ncbi:hypothetical protein AVEN_111046-1 [Araneus ventricosus]|uniref:Uncharacterized protein n=1 Tax=Araneus ventricosus TaxID=182803 RepID=A0A4Y2SIN7_ARAVE|nr:hypothetical protein AVEN_111046-1 [Araneus ventricosus]